MMGHREELRGGDEFDALCRRTKRLLHWRPGVRRTLKRQFSKRIRRGARLAAELELRRRAG
jgi:hypothetical protein